jgi:hypothetical protein
LAFARAWLANAQSRHALGAYLERVVFSSSGACLRHQLGQASVKTDAALFLHDFPARQVCLDEANWLAALQASCSIPMVLDPVWDLPGAPQGPYWDGGLTDYHLRLNYTALKPGLVLYPHFVDKLIPGWLDKPWFWRHRTSAALIISCSFVRAGHGLQAYQTVDCLTGMILCALPTTRLRECAVGVWCLSKRSPWLGPLSVLPVIRLV